MIVEEVPSLIPSIPFVGVGGAGHSKRGGGAFVFDNVFDEESSTSQLYDAVVRPVVRAVLDGRHATVCAYGATKSGKTHTMQGGVVGGGDQRGVIQRAAADLFEHVEKDVGRSYKVTAQYFEVYNEQLRDLLAGSEGHRQAPIPCSNAEPLQEFEGRLASQDSDDDEDNCSDDDTVSLVPPAPSTRGKNLSPRKLLHSFAVASSPTKTSHVNRPTAPSSDRQAKQQRKAPSVLPPQLQLRETNGVLTISAVEEEIYSVEDVVRLLDHGARNRAVAKVQAGPMMAQSHHLSSRSHAIFRITVESHGSSSPAVLGATRWVSVLNLVDLAGSENTDRSGTSGLRLREGGTINQRYGSALTAVGWLLKVLRLFGCLIWSFLS